MARKVGMVNVEVRSCSECPFLRFMCTPSGLIGSDLRFVPTTPGQVGGPEPNQDVGWGWWMCGRLGQQITALTTRPGNCPLVEIDQNFQDELIINIGDPKNHSPHQTGKGPVDQ